MAAFHAAVDRFFDRLADWGERGWNAFERASKWIARETATEVGIAVATSGSSLLLTGSRQAIRAALRSAGVSDDLARGIRSVLGSGKGTYAVELLDDGALIHRYVPGGDPGKSAIYTYRLDSSGRVMGLIQRAFDEMGNITHFDPKKGVSQW